MRASFPTRRIDVTIAASIWILVSLFEAINLGPLRLVAHIETRPQQVARLTAVSGSMPAFFQSMPLVQQWNEVIFTLPMTEVLPAPRFEPVIGQAPYRVLSMSWQRAGLTSQVPLSRVVGIGSGRPIGDVVLRSGFDATATPAVDGNVFAVPPPPTSFVGASFSLLVALPLFGAVLLLHLLRGKLALKAFAAVMIGGACACYAWIVWRLGPSGAVFDDWRYLLPGTCNLVDGGLDWLTCSSNDTYYLTNQIIDLALLRLSHVDFRWIRACGLAVLMLQVFLQVRVIEKSCGNRTAVCAVAIALTLWSLASSSYWGTTALGYQQALPTLCGTAMLGLLIGDRGHLREATRMLPLVLLALASGLAYISGPLLVLSLAVALIPLSIPRHFRPTRRFLGAVALTTLGFALLAAQVAIVNSHQGSLLEHTHAAASVLPNDHRFWLFFAALFGRACGYSGTSAMVDAGFAMIALAPGCLTAFESLRVSLGHRIEPSRDALLLLPTYAAIGCVTYAAAVAFGRSGMVGVDASTHDITLYAKSRFHYWPVAAMLPFAWLGWVRLAETLRYRGRMAVLALSGLLFLVPKSSDTLYLAPALDANRYVEMNGAHCVAQHRGLIDGNEPVSCPIMTGIDVDIRPVLKQLKERNSPLFFELIRKGTPVDEPANDDSSRAGLL